MAVAAGSIAHLLSIAATFSHAFDARFEASKYVNGGISAPKRSCYHAWRGGCLAMGAVLVWNMAINAPEQDRNPLVHNLTCVTAGAYYVGWWGGAPFGLHTPNWKAELVHITGGMLIAMGLALSRPSFTSANQSTE
jgi:hypothetical protein